MRLVCALLAIFVLFLSVQPVCGLAVTAGQDACCESTPAAAAATAAADEHPEAPHEDCRNCNPFQACTCCAPAVMPAPDLILVSEEVPIASKAHNFVANVHCPKGQGSGFWQPPRVA